MRILHAAAELFPIVKTGGLGDVLAALPPAQRAAGMDARLVLPGYPAVMAAITGLKRLAWLGPLFGARQVSLLGGRVPGSAVPAYVVEAASLFDRPGNPYLGPDGADWPDNALRFGLLSWVAAQLARGLPDPDWRADILQAHDWHAGLAPAYLALADDGVQRPASILTIHNLAYQGLFPSALLAPLGLPESVFQPDGLEFWGRLSFLKAGLVYADHVTTVSPSYAREITTPEFGCGLNGVIAARGGAVSGILNGVDEREWNPEADPVLASAFSSRDLAARAANRTALASAFGLALPDGPLYGVVSRLTPQKGLDLLLAALPALLDGGGALALLGSGDRALESAFVAAAERDPRRIGVRLAYDDALAHRIMAGADAVLVPSRFEPCGLTQLYALRYGALPVVRRTGGLGDTVVDAASGSDGTGFSFEAASAEALAATLRRVAATYAQPEIWTRLQRNAMAQHFRWSDSAAAYGMLYTELVRTRDHARL